MKVFIVLVIVIIISIEIYISIAPESTIFFDYEYTIDIEVNEEGYYSILTPMPVWVQNKSKAEFIIDNLMVTQGNATFDIIQTIHGLALNITAYDDARIEFSGIYEFLDDGVPKFDMSMINNSYNNNQNLEDVGHHIMYYQSNTNQNLSASVIFDNLYSTNIADYNYQGDISMNSATANHWQTIEGQSYIGFFP